MITPLPLKPLQQTYTDFQPDEFGRDLAELLWSHGFTRSQCARLITKWVGTRADCLVPALKQLELQDWTHHEHLPPGA